MDALDITGETLYGTGEPRFEPEGSGEPKGIGDPDDNGRGGGGAGEWQRLTAGLCVGVVRVRSGWERARGEGKWKAGWREGRAVVDITLCTVTGRGGTLMDLGCPCCCCCRPTGDAEGSLGCSALDLTSCRMSGSSRTNIVAVAIGRH